ncbi:F0F1 ATP synthase subunit delta [Pseudoclavibacter helvolus]|uniref:ATP synthase subunit delta n=1 Tax=Pseudoclavibacter helvolus TaxID=255205 RepID=A0A7W4UM42_9MICO|nr:F0F1 ATP synthase subunit delta [Pseudoclavibacter helvolus]MBB2956888.1 F-type H+-transporting ATPase subunit delta [Pseudoclavibacter helvolus]
MGSATRHALAALKNSVDGWGQAELRDAEQVFAAVNAAGANQHLLVALSNPAADVSARRELAGRVFGSHLSPRALQLLQEAVSQTWSSNHEFALGLQELAVRATAQTAGEQSAIAAELTTVADTISANPELELTLGSRLGDSAVKSQLVERLFAGKISAPSLLILRELVGNPLGRRTRRLLTWAGEVVADQAGRSVATVTVASPLAPEQLAKLEAGLTRRFNRRVFVTTVIDPKIIGGLRVQLGDDVIDDSVAARLNNLRLQLA